MSNPLPPYLWYLVVPVAIIALYFVSLRFELRSLLNFVFRLLADLFNDAEKSFQDFLMAIVPYAVPIIPAYMTVDHVRKYMDFPAWVAYTAGFVVEAFGITSITTAIKFYYHNRKYKTGENKAPFLPALLSYLTYVLIVVVTNIVLEIVAGTRNGMVIFSISLFTLLSVPSGVLIAIRTQYSQVLESIETKYHKPKNNKPNNVPTPAPSEGGTYRDEKPASAYHDKIIGYLDAEYKKSGAVLTPKQITTRLKINHANNKGYVSATTKKWKEQNGIQ